MANHLLPQQAANQAINQPNKNHFTDTPFSTKPMPGVNKKRDHEDHGAIDKKKHRGKLNPFDISRGPKFKGE